MQLLIIYFLKRHLLENHNLNIDGATKQTKTILNII